MAFQISEFKSQLAGGGARPTLFEVQLTIPGAQDDVANQVRFMTKAAALPASTVGFYSLPYFGRQIKYAGDRTFEPWTVTIINDEDFAIRNALEAWSNTINEHTRNFRALPDGTDGYKKQAQVKQFGKANETVIREYQFEGLFPVSIDAISLGWDQTDAIEEYSVTFEYDLWTVSGTGTTGVSTT